MSAPEQQDLSSTIGIWTPAEPVNDGKHFYSYGPDAYTIRPPWEGHMKHNWAAVILGVFALRFITGFANRILDHILLYHFPELALDWCFVHEGGPKTSRLRRTQASCLKGLGAMTILMRWPGRDILHMHLWECIRFAVALFAVSQVVLIITLLSVHAYIWTGEKLAALTGWDPVRGGRAMRAIRFGDGTVPDTPPQKFSGSDMPRKHPSSVGMGRFLKDIRLEGVNMPDTFVTREWNSNRKEDEMVVYHAITTQEKYWDFSFEELKLQHYEDTGRFKSPKKSDWLKDQVKNEEESLLSRSVGKVLPSWLSSRTFRDSAFSNSTSSNDGSIEKLNASLAAGQSDSPSMSRSAPDLLTGEEAMVRRFT
ncbi:hypothetical protein Slin15195_G048810 [Septoria linicola]|uniref:Uncharacterized protein n=1 Tax=Septoria linicola TaxID=215465 RepID=A0A9Q9ALD8_9PEZI|nr:hypothetical protein Slin15195_G048810 [Septoria linicola]